MAKQIINVGGEKNYNFLASYSPFLPELLHNCGKKLHDSHIFGHGLSLFWQGSSQITPGLVNS